jgi:hypothetical protein
MATYYGRFKMASNTAVGWTAANTVLLAGELGLESDTGFIKIGNGATAWNSLGYAFMALTGAQEIAGVKTFLSSPIVPTPTTNFQAATKKYVDDEIADVVAGGVSDADSLGGVAANLYALKTYVDSAIANLINSAPGALDTLDELAAALGDDANFAASVTTSLAGKQATLVSATNIKTINGSSILGSGDLVVSGGGGGMDYGKTLAIQSPNITF